MKRRAIVLLGHIFDDIGSTMPACFFSLVYAIVKQTLVLTFFLPCVQSACNEISLNVFLQDNNDVIISSGMEPATLGSLSGQSKPTKSRHCRVEVRHLLQD